MRMGVHVVPRLLAPGRKFRPSMHTAPGPGVGGRGLVTPFRQGLRRGTTTPAGAGRPAARDRLDEACLQRETGEIGSPSASGLVPDAVEVRADGADADVQLAGDLGVGSALGD